MKKKIKDEFKSFMGFGEGRIRYCVILENDRGAFGIIKYTTINELSKGIEASIKDEFCNGMEGDKAEILRCQNFDNVSELSLDALITDSGFTNEYNFTVKNVAFYNIIT